MDNTMSSQRLADNPLCSSRDQHSIQTPLNHAPIPTPQPKLRQRQSRQKQSQLRRRQLISITSLPTTQLLLLTFFLTCISLSSASTIYIPEQMVETETPKDPSSQPVADEDLASALARLARSGPILVDLSPPPKPANAQAKDWTLATVADDLRKRQVGGNDPESSSSSSKTSSTSTATAKETDTSSAKVASTAETPSSTKLAPTQSSSSVVAAETTAVSPLPTVFDNGFNGNITNSCATFMTSMLTNDSFKKCLPFSLLLQNSNSFFQASKSITRITQTLDATCSANSTFCSNLLSSYATNITAADACASDISTENPLIAQAHLGLLAYKPLYTASCLRNPQTSSYCFADAITNKTSPTNGYIYYLPLNVSLPGGSQPTCNNCLKDTMGVFGAASGDKGSALLSTYVSAAMQVNVQCGPQFVNISLATPASFGVPSFAASPSTALFALVVVVASWLL